MARIACAACGTVQEAASEAARCVICGAALRATEGEPPRPRGPGEAAVPSSSTSEVFDVDAGRKAETPAEVLQAEPGRRAAELDEIFAAEKRTTTALSLIPVWGIWRIWRSDVHALPEKWFLSALSLVLTVALAFVAWRALPGEADRTVETKASIDRDLVALEKLVERFRGQRGTFPEATVWGDSVRRRDPRFFDPWGNPYRYTKRPNGFSIGTYGRDGERGGEGADADVFREFPH